MLYTSPMHKKKNQKNSVARRVVLYTIMSVSVVLIVSCLILIIMGYRFNRQDGKLEQGGLLQFNSKPSGAQIYINDGKLAFNTANKATVASGEHTVKFSKQGYHDWQKTVNLGPSGVLWLNYARLIPTELSSKTVEKFPSVADTLASPNDKYILMSQVADQPAFTLLKINNKQVNKTSLNLPADSFVEHSDQTTDHNYEMTEWDKDGRHVLVRHSYKQSDIEKAEWISVDTRDVNRSVNVTTTVGVTAESMQYSFADSHILYSLSTGDLRKINLNDATLSRPLVSNVADFDQFDRATVTYTTHLDAETGKRSVGYYTDNAKKPRVVRSFADNGSTKLTFRVGEYFSKKYYLFSYGETVEVMSGDLPSSDSRSSTAYTPVITITIPDGVRYIDFGENPRFILAQNGNKLTTYDLELKNVAKFEVPGDAASIGEIDWIDNFHVVSTADNTIRMYEFDGQNPKKLVGAMHGQSVVLSDDDKYIYSFKQSDDSVELNRLQLVVN